MTKDSLIGRFLLLKMGFYLHGVEHIPDAVSVQLRPIFDGFLVAPIC